MLSPDTIFLIDDDAIQLMVATKMIEQAIPVKKIVPFSDAKTALDFLQVHAKEPALLPDIILLDLNMPEISGWDFLKIFEKNRSLFSKEIQIHILSSSQDEKDIEKSKDFTSVYGYTVKPLTGEKIRSLVSN